MNEELKQKMIQSLSAITGDLGSLQKQDYLRSNQSFKNRQAEQKFGKFVAGIKERNYGPTTEELVNKFTHKDDIESILSMIGDDMAESDMSGFDRMSVNINASPQKKSAYYSPTFTSPSMSKETTASMGYAGGQDEQLTGELARQRMREKILASIPGLVEEAESVNVDPVEEAMERQRLARNKRAYEIADAYKQKQSEQEDSWLYKMFSKNRNNSSIADFFASMYE
jgi:hypothetical protein